MTIFSQTTTIQARNVQTLVVAGGCFWCFEAGFESVDGVSEAASGYAGGISEHPTYKTLEGTGHYEVVKITYDASIVTHRKLLDLFLRSVDPTDAGSQFCDRGATYRPAIFIDGLKQRRTAKAVDVIAGEAVVGRRRAVCQPLKAITSTSSGITSAVPSRVTLRAAAKLAVKSAAFGASPSDRRPIK